MFYIQGSTLDQVFYLIRNINSALILFYDSSFNGSH